MKVVTFDSNPICCLSTIHNKYLVAGYENGSIKFYDFEFKIIAWFEDLGFSEIKSISFSTKKMVKAENQMPHRLAQEMAGQKKDKNADEALKNE